MQQYIYYLFSNMSLLTAILMGAGVLLCVVEIFVPRIGLTGILGFILIVLGFSSYYIDGFKPNQIISLISIVAFALAVFIMIEMVLESKGIIKNTNRYKFRPIIQQPLCTLIGKEGVTYRR